MNASCVLGSPCVLPADLRLPAAALRGVEVLAARVGADDLERLSCAADGAERRELLSEVVRGWIDDAVGASTQAFAANVGAIVLAALAVRHSLEEGAEPASLAAAASIPWLLEDPSRRLVLAPGVIELLQDLIDGIALEDGRAVFVRRMRGLLDRAARLDPRALDLVGRRLVLGGQSIVYRRGALRQGRRVAEQRYIGRDNAEGRLLLLLAAGRAPKTVSPSVLSHLRAALAATDGGINVSRRQLELSPPVVLTARAARAAARVKWVQRPGVPADLEDEVRPRYAAPTDPAGGARGGRGRASE